MSIDERIGDWNTSLPRVYTPVRQDPNDIPLEGLSDHMRKIILDARERYAREQADERVEQDGVTDEPS